MKLPLIQIDKANHFIYGFAIFVLMSLLVPILNLILMIFSNGLSEFMIGFIPLLTVILFAIGKEFYDKYIKKTYFDLGDMVMGIIPALIMYAQSLI